MKLAFDNLSGDVVIPTAEQHAAGCAAASASARKRMILPIHRRQEAPVQRMMNYLQPGTYIRPHRHPRPGACETLVVLSGGIRFFRCDEQGGILNAAYAKTGAVIDLEDNVWHSFVVTEPDTVLFESKMGPYDTVLDKEFAGWSPAEFSPEADVYRKNLESYAG